MKDFSWRSKLYILTTIIAGCAILAKLAINNEKQNYWILLGIASLASVTLLFKVEGTTNRSHYNISFLIYGATFTFLGPEACITVIILSYLVDWILNRYPWYIQGFNIASLVIVVSLSGLLYKLINPDLTLLSFEGILAIMASMAFFTLLNHLMMGLVVWFARGENFSKSGMLDILPLMIDYTLLCMGVGCALIWMFNPFAVPLVLLPLYLIFTTLRVPALERETEIDSKTGLYNAKYFSKVIKSELDRAQNFDRPLTVVLADLDLLRNINNTYGHLAGDEVLIGVANILKNSLREFDIVARFGGEEFIILMPETSPDDAHPIIENLRTAIEKNVISIPTSLKPISVTISFGIAGRTGLTETANDIIHNADSALYHSKLNGRNRTCKFSDDGSSIVFTLTRQGSSSDRVSNARQQYSSENNRHSPNPLRVSSRPNDQATKHIPPPAQTTGIARPRWLINLFIGLLILIAIPIVIFLDMPVATIDWFGLFLFGSLVVITEGLSIDIYVKNTSVSTSAAPILAGTLLYGPLGAVVLGLTFALVSKIKHRSPINRFVFNSVNHLIAGLLISYLIIFSGKLFTENILSVQLLICVVAAMIMFLSTTMLVALAINIDTGAPFKEVWKVKFSWLTPYYVSMGLIAYALILGYRTTGFIGLAVILVPLLMLRLSVKQYIDRTISMVNELRRKNTLLEKSSQEINILNEDLLNVLAETIDLRDPFTLGHSQYVTRYAVLLARKLGLSADSIAMIRKAGLLHDIGKIGVPDAILMKPFPLTSEEHQIIQQHTILGADILKNSHSMQHLSPIIRHHHERYDGSGYPDRLAGKEIPIESRIIAVADSVEAMASDRPYRRALSMEKIEEQLIRNSSTQFDPMIIESMLQILRERKENVVVNSAEKLTVEQCEYAFVEPGSRGIITN
jgi:diguanylate cyclase (GGDEF)-like protein/putative nucleotidyltransferase with HDIG domain